MPSVEEIDALNCLKDDWGTAYEITCQPGQAGPYRAVRRDDSNPFGSADSRPAPGRYPGGLLRPAGQPGRDVMTAAQP